MESIEKIRETINRKRKSSFKSDYSSKYHISLDSYDENDSMTKWFANEIERLASLNWGLDVLGEKDRIHLAWEFATIVTGFEHLKTLPCRKINIGNIYRSVTGSLYYSPYNDKYYVYERTDTAIWLDNYAIGFREVRVRVKETQKILLHKDYTIE